MSFFFISPKKLHSAGVLGMNRRNLECISRWNSRRNFPLVDNKLKTKLAAQEAGIAVPELIGVVRYQHEIKTLVDKLRDQRQFVIKPVQGSGGKGILVIVERDGDKFIKPSGASLNYIEVQRHVSNILSGLFSLGGRLDQAMIEALVNFDNYLAHYSFEGVPDVRIVVYRGFPVMAMMRCATHASDGKANLHQGAVGVGIDLGDGGSLGAVQKGHPVKIHPDTKHNLLDLKVPLWDRILHLAASCYEMTGLGYIGTDIVIDRDHGPLILELNARPGLAIQVANHRGLVARLKKVDLVAETITAVDDRIRFSQNHFSTLAERLTDRIESRLVKAASQ